MNSKRNKKLAGFLQLSPVLGFRLLYTSFPDTRKRATETLEQQFVGLNWFPGSLKCLESFSVCLQNAMRLRVLPYKNKSNTDCTILDREINPPNDSSVIIYFHNWSLWLQSNQSSEYMQSHLGGMKKIIYMTR